MEGHSSEEANAREEEEEVDIKTFLSHKYLIL